MTDSGSFNEYTAYIQAYQDYGSNFQFSDPSAYGSGAAPASGAFGGSGIEITGTPIATPGGYYNTGLQGQMYAPNAFPALPAFDKQDFSDFPQEYLSKIYNLEDKYPAWTEDTQAPLTKGEIWEIFKDLQQKLGFQPSSCENMFDHFMVQLDSRSSRFPAPEALVSLHSDYIGGPNSNYRKWYFAAHLDLDEEIGLGSDAVRSSTETPQRLTEDEIEKFSRPADKFNLSSALFRWKTKMSKYSYEDMVSQIALYLMIWGESNQIRFLPECLCYLYKCASDYVFADPLKEEQSTNEIMLPENDFLDRVITPIYNFIKGQQFEKINGKYFRRERDHSKIIGYDDMNQLFWYPEGIHRIITTDGTRLSDMNKTKRYSKLGRVDWSKTFYKTYLESRSWFHLITNFNRIWTIHFAVFWYVTAFNSTSLYTPNYHQRLDNPPTPQAVWSVTSLAGAISCVVYLLAVIGEMAFIPKKWPGRERCTGKLFFGLFLFLLNASPSIYVFVIIPVDVFSMSAYIVAIVQFGISIVTVIFFSIRPLGGLFGSYMRNNKKFISSQTFTASFPKLKGPGQTCSYMLWCSVFSAKFLESYLFVTLSLKDPVRNLSTMSMNSCVGDAFIASFVCKQQPRIVLILMFATDLVLFFLDTYLWYIICNCAFSIMLSFTSGMSIFSPWRNAFTRLPQRIGAKILSSSESEGKFKTKFLISQVWNSIIINMYQDHVLSREHAARLLYHQASEEVNANTKLKEPLFFMNQDDGADKMSDYLPSGSAAERRISYFAHSLSTRIPDPLPVDSMPTFTVLVPHYSEKILLTLKDVIKEDKESKISLLEYLKALYPFEWKNFVEDSKELNNLKHRGSVSSEGENEKDGDDSEEAVNETGVANSPFNSLATTKLNQSVSDIPYYCVGFKNSSPDKVLRTRIWASLRSQTLYRTISGFSKYTEAIRILYRTENLDLFDSHYDSVDSGKILNYIANRKVNIVVSMQRFQNFSHDELEAVNILVSKFPFIKIVTLEEVPSENEDDDPSYYSCLLGVDGSSSKKGSPSSRKEIAPELTVLYRIKLSGNPIIGDGKSDNQNHAIVFYRGEYIQVIDANQDMYLEECLKVRSVLMEFEEMGSSKTDRIYDPNYLYPDEDPVAVVGAREHIFTEQAGILGDVAAGKEKTFGTLFARTLAEIGGKLHYGHPDFLNAIFMTTRGGISKAQKGIHLNEDIYAGMTAVCRGGIIKHSDFFQCGKGRDLGFSSILNFTTKIGAGMGEQILSREYFYLGTQLPLHRFLSFYYAHAGFHLNNLFIILSVQLFMMVIINLGALNHEVIKCTYDKHVPFTDLQSPLGCYNLQPVLDWINTFVISICICFFISFAPLMVQEFTERGPIKAFCRFFRHFLSLSPIFEVFVCQVYSNSLKNNLTFGGARYIATGRGFSTSRSSFTDLYSRYAGLSIYSGIRLALMLLFATLSMWQIGLLWFWLTAGSLCLSPFIFNPHQFSIFDHFLDYREFIRWLTRGNSRFDHNSWIAYTRASRSKITGSKKKTWKEENMLPTSHRVALANRLFSEIGFPAFQAGCAVLSYHFINSQTGVKNPVELHLVFRILILTLAPILINSIVLGCLFPIICIIGPILKLCKCAKGGNFFAALAHSFGLINHLFFFEATMLLEGWEVSRGLSCFISTVFLQRVIFQVIKICFLTRELKADYANRAWWSGDWFKRGSGTLTVTQPFREYVVKVVEMSLFAADFIIGHLIFISLSPMVFIPYIDRLHSSMMFWLKPQTPYRRGIKSITFRKVRRRRAWKYSMMLLFTFLLMSALVTGPIVIGMFIGDLRQEVHPAIAKMMQPIKQDNNDTGSRAPLDVVTAKPSFSGYKTHPY